LLWAERGCFFCWMSDASRLAFSLPTFLFDWQTVLGNWKFDRRENGKIFN
jgi:hypothetical protein